ncbi:ABC transporter [Paraliobacillus quinghaiensis]|uniref:ABC transporter n=1 Tax=Paraliobacillus quinghaiensis TaxID=470815 RepID=A0A917TJA2_9BACI|nr:ABC transporter ATP-binding protein [Paraliobacillus quinghaiensis]GGM25280.1 ABC transporter [Paraliobacillus quinghaiensis]
MQIVKADGLEKKFGSKKVIEQMSFEIKEETITGIIGRNGAGKTTLLKMIAGFWRPSAGELLVFNEEPFDSLMASANTIYIDDQLYYPDTLNLKQILQQNAQFYPNWNMDLADRLFNYFGFEANQRHYQLSKGKRSTFNMIIGLAARCPLTLFDEPTTGMDEAVRKDFYQALLHDYIAFPRTILLSSHLLQEIEPLLEEVLLIKDGKVLMHESVDTLKDYAFGLHGDRDTITSWCANKSIIYQKAYSSEGIYVVVQNDFTEREFAQLQADGIKLLPVSLNDLCIYLTNPKNGGIVDVLS